MKCLPPLYMTDIVHDSECLLKYVTRNIFRCQSPLPSVCDRSLQSQIPTACADRDSSSPSGNLPALRHDVPDGEVDPRERHRHRRRLARREEDAVEALQVEWRAFRRGRRGCVQLRDLEETLSSI